MGEEDGEKKGRFTFCKKLFAKGSTFSMVVFVFFEVCCFQLCQVASTTLALEEFGAENIPYLYIVVAGANVIAIPILTWIGTRLYQKVILFGTVWVTLILLGTMWYSLVSTKVIGSVAPDDDGSGSADGVLGDRATQRQQIVVITFLAVEILMAYDIDQFWCYVEESCNLQQAKVLFNVVNYGNAFATGAIGVGLFTLDWEGMLINGLEDLILLGLIFLCPCLFLAKIVAPASRKTGADLAKDREKLMKATAKKRMKAKKKLRKSGVKSNNIADMLDDFSVADSGGGKNVIWLLLIDPLCPYIALVTFFIVGLDTFFGWQFLELMQIKLIEEDGSLTSTAINSEIAKYLGIISAGSVVLIVVLQNVTSWLMAKYGTFICCLNLPMAVALHAASFSLSEEATAGKNQLAVSRAIYMAFIQLNFGFTRTLWYAVPDSIRNAAYAIIADFLPAAVKGASALVTIIVIELGVHPSDPKLMIISVLCCGVWGITLLYRVRQGYVTHLMGSISRRSMDAGAVHLDVTNEQVVAYVREFIVLGDKNQQFFILNLLRNASLDNFVAALRGMYQKNDTSPEILAKVIEICRSDNRIIRDSELMEIITNEPKHAPVVVSSALLACGERNLRRAKPTAEKLLYHKFSVEIRLSAALALLHMKPEKTVRSQVKDIISESLAVQASVADRISSLRTIELSLREKANAVVAAGAFAGGQMRSIDVNKMPRARSSLIKELKIDFILPLVALNLSDVATAHEAAAVLHKFDSAEVSRLFARILSKDLHGAFFTQPVFEFLADTCARVSSNAIITTMLETPQLKQPDQLGSSVAGLAFRTIVAIAKNVGLSPKQAVTVSAMAEEELHRAYRKVTIIHWLNNVPFSAMLVNYLDVQLKLTQERIMLLLACLLPFDPVDEYAEAILYSSDDAMVSNALEVMENIAPREIWIKTMPLVDRGNDWKDKQAVAALYYPDLEGSIDEVLEEYLVAPSEIWPAFILDVIIKNELYDFLDSIDWLAIRANMRKLHGLKASGKLLDGANVMLEIVARDSHMQRDMVAEIKKKVKNAKRFEMLEAKQKQAEERSVRREEQFEVVQKPGIGFRLKLAAEKALFGAVSVDASSDERQQLRSLSSSDSAMLMSTTSLDGNDDNSDSKGCFGKKSDENKGAKNKAAERRRRLAELKEKRRLEKIEAEYDVVFNIEFAEILPDGMHQPVKSEFVRRSALLRKHQRAAAVYVPRAAEVDIDKKDTEPDAAETGGYSKRDAQRDAAAQKKKGLKGLLRRNKDKAEDIGQAEAPEEVEEDPVLMAQLQAQEEEAARQQMILDVGFISIAQDLNDLKKEFELGELEGGQDEFEAKKNAIINRALGIEEDAPEESKPDNPGDTNAKAVVKPDDDAADQGDEATDEKTVKQTANPLAQVDADQTAGELAVVKPSWQGRPAHTVSLLLGRVPVFVDLPFDETKLTVGDVCMLSRDLWYGCLQLGELGEIVYDATNYTDRYGLVLKVKPFTFEEPREDDDPAPTWWYSPTQLVLAERPDPPDPEPELVPEEPEPEPEPEPQPEPEPEPEPETEEVVEEEVEIDWDALEEAALAQELEDKNEALQPILRQLNGLAKMNEKELKKKKKELIKTLKNRKLPFKDIEKEPAALAQRIKDSLQVDIEQIEAEHAAGAIESAALRAQLRAEAEYMPSKKRRAVVGGARLTYKATKLTTKAAFMTTKYTAKTAYKVATDKRLHAAVRVTGKATVKGTQLVAKGTAAGAKVAAPVISSGVKKGIEAAPVVMAGVTAGAKLAGTGAVAGAKLAGRGAVQSASLAKQGAVSINGRMRPVKEEEMDEDAQKRVLEQARQMARRQAAMDVELRKLRVLRNDGVITEDDFMRQEAYIHASSIPTADQDDSDDEVQRAAEVGVKVSVVKLFAPIKYGKGEFDVRRSELESWVLKSFGSSGRRKKRMEKAHLWANCLLSAGISSLGHLQELIENDKVTVADLVSIGLRPKQQCTSLIELMKVQVLDVRIYAALAIQRYYRYLAWRKKHSDNIQKRVREIVASKTLAKGLAAMVESKWFVALDIFEAGLNEETGSPEHLGLQQGRSRAEMEIEIQEDESVSRKDVKLRHKEYHATVEAESRAEAARLETERLSRLETAQNAAAQLMVNIENGEWEKEEQMRKEALAAAVLEARMEKQRLKALAAEQAVLDEIEAQKQAILEAKRQKQEEKQAKKDAKLQAKLELKQAKEEDLLNLEHAKAEEKAAKAEAKEIKMQNQAKRKNAKAKSKQLGKASKKNTETSRKSQDKKGDEDDVDEDDNDSDGDDYDIDAVLSKPLDGDTDTHALKHAGDDVPVPEEAQSSLYDDMSKKHLKSALKEQGLSIKGTREELVKRLVQAAANADEDETTVIVTEEEQAEIDEKNEAKQAALEHLQATKAEFASMKAPQLRKELEARGLETSGKKDVLMERLAQALDEEHEKEYADAVDAQAPVDPYESLSKKRLKKTLRKHNLSTIGTRSRLVRRLQEHAVRMDEFDEAERLEIEAERAEKEAALAHLVAAKAEYAQLKAPQLRKKLEQRGLATNGSKSKLMERLAQAVEAEEQIIVAEHDVIATSSAAAREIIRAGGEDPRLIEPEPDWEAIEADAFAQEAENRQLDLDRLTQLRDALSDMTEKEVVKQLNRRGFDTFAGLELLQERLDADIQSKLATIQDKIDPLLSLQGKLAQKPSKEIKKIMKKRKLEMTGEPSAMTERLHLALGVEITQLESLQEPLRDLIVAIPSKTEQELLKTLKHRKLDTVAELPQLRSRLEAAIGDEIDAVNAKHDARAIKSAKLRAKIKAGPSLQRRALIGGAKMTGRATAKTAQVAGKATATGAKAGAKLGVKATKAGAKMTVQGVKMTVQGSKATYEKMDKAHLVAACRRRGLDTEGTKDELVERMAEWAAANGEQALVDEEEENAILLELERKEEALEHLRKAHAGFEEKKAPALRKELAQRGLDTSGKKAELMERLARAIDAEADAVAKEHTAAAHVAREARIQAKAATAAAKEAAHRFRPKEDWMDIGWEKVVDVSSRLSASKSWCELQKEHLVWYKDRPEKGSPKVDPMETVPLVELSMHVDSDSFGKVEHPLKQKMLWKRENRKDKILELEAETAEDMADWVSAIETAWAVLIYKEKAKVAEKRAKRKAEEEIWNWRTAVGDGDSTDASRAEGALVVHHNSSLRGPRWVHLSIRWLVLYEDPDETDNIRDRVKIARIPMESIIVRHSTVDAQSSTLTVDIMESSRLDGLDKGIIEFEADTPERRAAWVRSLHTCSQQCRNTEISFEQLRDRYDLVCDEDTALLTIDGFETFLSNCNIRISAADLSAVFGDILAVKEEAELRLKPQLFQNDSEDGDAADKKKKTKKQQKKKQQKKNQAGTTEKTSARITWTDLSRWFFGQAPKGVSFSRQGTKFKAQLKRVMRAESHALQTDSEKAFQRVDTDNDGALDRDEFDSLMDEMEIDWPKSERDNIFNEMDEDKNGTIDLHEWQNFWRARSVATDNSKSTNMLKNLKEKGSTMVKSSDAHSVETMRLLEEMFSNLDGDGNGLLDRDEFKEWLSEMGLHMEPLELEQAFDEIDTDGNGGLDFDEVVAFYTKEVNKSALTKHTENLSAAGTKVRNRMKLMLSKRSSVGGSGDEESGVDFSVDQSQLQGTRRIAALGTEVSYHFSEMTGPYRQLHNDALGVLNEKQKHGFSTVDKLVYLHQTMLFENISLTETLRVAQVAEQINMREGDVLFDNGEEGNAAYFIMVGELMLHVDGITIPMNNRRKPLGEVGLLYSRPRAGKIVATCNTVVLGLMRDDLEILFERKLISQSLVTAALAVLTVSGLRSNYGMLEAKQSVGDTGNSLALEVARAGWTFDTTDFLYVGKTNSAARHVKSRKHDLENHISSVAKQKHLDAAVMDSESYSPVERIILLKSCKLFEDTSDVALSQVADIVRMIRVPAGVTLYNEGDPGFDAFIIASGQVRLEKTGRILGFRGRGDVNGATSLVIGGDPRAATVITAKDTLIMNLSKDRLDAVMETSPELHRGMIKVLMERLFDTYKRINAIKRVEQRVDYFRQYQGDMRLDVQNLRRMPASGRVFAEDDAAP